VRSIATIGLMTIAFGWGWLAWKFFEADYARAKQQGGPEWARIERLTALSVIVAATFGTILTAALLFWLDSR